MNNTPPTPNTHNDEIDLFELIITLWKSKGLIIGITFLSTIIAGLIAFFVISPEYKATTIVTQPQPYQIESLNMGIAQAASEKNPITVEPIRAKDVFTTFTNTLNSKNLQRAFFRTHYLPTQKDGAIQDNQRGFQSFQKTLSISADKDNQQTTISFTSVEPALAYQFINEYLNLTKSAAAEEILKNRTAEVNNVIQNIKSSLQSLESEITAENRFLLIQLKSALQTAEKLNITEPQKEATELYQQGSTALSAQIAFLESQLNNFSGNKEYNALTSQLAKYNSAELPSASETTVYGVNYAAEVPEIPTKPNKKLIVIIGFLLGGMLSVMIVLLRQAIRNYKLRTL